ncbi:hypothetical protein [Emticicia fontis]
MEQNIQIDTDFLKGFNEGYLIAKHEPELSAELTKISSKSSRIVGFKKGQEQFVLEQKIEMLPEWLRDNQQTKNIDESEKLKNREIDLER